MSEEKLTILNLRGSWREMGREYGVRLAQELRHVLAFVDKEIPNMSPEYFFPRGLPVGVSVVDELFLGVSEGAGLTLEELKRINVVEVAYGHRLVQFFQNAMPGKCSALALYGDKTRDGQVLYGRNYDWLPEFSELGLVLTHYHPTDSELSFAVLNFPGCLYMTTGMNSTGLFIELNDASFASTEVDFSRIHNAWQLWEVLTQSRSAEEAIGMLQQRDAQYNYVIGVADATRCFSYEWSIRESAVVTGDGDALAMANHFVHPNWQNRPVASAGGAISSVCRRQALLNQASKVPAGTGDLETMKRIFELTVEDGGARWIATLFQVLAEPAKRQMVIRLQDGPWTEFCF